MIIRIVAEKMRLTLTVNHLNRHILAPILVERSFRTNVSDPPVEERLQTENEVSRFQQLEPLPLDVPPQVATYSMDALSMRS